MSHDALTCIPYSSSLLRHDSCVMRHDSWCTFGCSLCNRIVTKNYFSHVRKKALHRARGTGTFHMYVFMWAIQCLLWVSSSLVEIKVVTYVYHEPERIFLPEREAAKILLSFAHNHKITDFSFSIVCCISQKFTLVLHTHGVLHTGGVSHTWRCWRLGGQPPTEELLRPKRRLNPTIAAHLLPMLDDADDDAHDDDDDDAHDDDDGLTSTFPPVIFPPGGNMTWWLGVGMWHCHIPTIYIISIIIRMYGWYV